MSVYFVEKEIRGIVEPLLEGMEDTLILSALSGYMGDVYTDSDKEPTAVQVLVADFCFYAGKANKELLLNRPGKSAEFVIMIPEGRDWEVLIEEVFEGCCKKISRYAIQKERDIFDREYLEKLVQQANTEFSYVFIGPKEYEQIRSLDWACDLCSQFDNYEDYAARGLGVCALYENQVVAGCSSYTVYPEGYEIEIDTRSDFRRRHLALICAAKFILEALDRGKYPSWDAHNMGSVALAEKLGYHFKGEYTAYEVF